MSTLGMVLTCILLVVSIILIIIILMQNNRAAGLGAISSSNSDTYWSKNKGNSMEGTLEKYTKVFGALFLILALVINFVR